MGQPRTTAALAPASSLPQAERLVGVFVDLHGEAAILALQPPAARRSTGRPPFPITPLADGRFMAVRMDPGRVFSATTPSGVWPLLANRSHGSGPASFGRRPSSRKGVPSTSMSECRSGKFTSCYQLSSATLEPLDQLKVLKEDGIAWAMHCNATGIRMLRNLGLSPISQARPNAPPVAPRLVSHHVAPTGALEEPARSFVPSTPSGSS